MQKVITINLNGNAYQLDETDTTRCARISRTANAQLGGNPDKAEIIRDLEQSIAEKCMRFLGPGKTVVSTAEVEQILREVGPVEGGAAPPAQPAQRLRRRRSRNGSIRFEKARC